MIELTGSAVCSCTSVDISSGWVLLAEVLIAEVLLVAELEMVLTESELLVKKGTILHESVILGEEKKVVSFSGVLPVTWCSWGLFS